MRRKLIAGNWKMNCITAEGKALARGLAEKQAAVEKAPYELLICPPFTLLHPLGEIVKDSGIALGAQDCAFAESGAYTGDVSPEMLADLGCSYVILGHSERRNGHGEKSEQVATKATAAQKSGLITIICVGELEAEREAGKEQAMVADQLAKSIPAGATAKNTVIAYEPVWAIGTGKTATPEDVATMHAFIREDIAGKITDPEAVRILYGGSMKPGNAAELLATPNVDGGLIGGASLKVEDFWGIAAATA